MPLSSVATASPPKSLPPPTSAYASSMNSTPPIARSMASLTLPAVWPDVPGDEPAAVGLDEVALRQHTERVEDPRQEARDGRLAGAGIADDDKVATRRHDRQSHARAAASSTRTRLATRRTSRLTSSRPISASSSSKRSSSDAGAISRTDLDAALARQDRRCVASSARSRHDASSRATSRGTRRWRAASAEWV